VDDEIFMEQGWGPSEDELDDCRYEEARSAAEILIDEQAEKLGLSLTAEERDEAIEELLETGVIVRFEEDRGGGSFSPAFETALEPRLAIASAQRWQRPWRPRAVLFVRRAPVRRAGRRAVRKQRRLVRRPSRAPGRSDDPHEDPVAARYSRRLNQRGGRS
jgi:hypothetical protein